MAHAPAAVGGGGIVDRHGIGEDREGAGERREDRVWGCDLRVVVICTDLKHWKMVKLNLVKSG